MNGWSTDRTLADALWREWPVVGARSVFDVKTGKWFKKPVHSWRDQPALTWDDVTGMTGVEFWAFKTGPVSEGGSGVILLDFDGEAGEETFSRIRLEPNARSGSGGAHLYVEAPDWYVAGGQKHPKWNDAWPGMDVRGWHQLAYFHGTSHKGPYQLLNAKPYPVSTLPEDLAQVLGLLSPPVEPERPEWDGTSSTAWGMTALAAECRTLTDCDSNRPRAAYLAGLKIGSIVAGESLDGDTARDALLEAARQNGSVEAYGESDILRSIDNGMKQGAKSPRGPKPVVLGTFEDPRKGAATNNMKGWKRGVDITATKVEWLWPGRIPKGKLTLLGGDGGDGKSFICSSLSAAISGGPKLPGMDQVDVGTVLCISYEDGLSDTLVPRAERHGAVMSRLIFRDLNDIDAEYLTHQSVDSVEAAISEIGDVRLLIIDPLMSFIGGTDMHTDAKVREVLGPWIHLAERTGVSIVALIHLNKGVQKALYRFMGSIAIPALSRSALIVGTLPDGTKGLARAKGNLSVAPPVIRYSVEDLDGPDTGQIVWGAELPQYSVEDIGGSAGYEAKPEQRGPKKLAPAVRSAALWLVESMVPGVEYPSKDVFRDAMDALGLGKDAVRDAFSFLGGHSRRKEHLGAYYWSLAKTPDTLREILEGESIG